MVARAAQLTSLSRSDSASPEVYTVIPGVTNIGAPDGSAPPIDTTTLQSTAREFGLQGLLDNGQVTADMLFDPAHAQHTGMLTDREAGTARNFRITFTDSPQSVWTFSALVVSLPATFGIDEAVQGTLTLKVNGAVTRT